MLFYFNRGNTFCIKHFCTICYFFTIASHHYDVIGTIQWRHCFYESWITMWNKVRQDSFSSLLLIDNVCIQNLSSLIRNRFGLCQKVLCRFLIAIRSSQLLNFSERIVKFWSNKSCRASQDETVQDLTTWTSNRTGTRMSENVGFTRTSILRRRRFYDDVDVMRRSGTAFQVSIYIFIIKLVFIFITICIPMGNAILWTSAN